MAMPSPGGLFEKKCPFKLLSGGVGPQTRQKRFFSEKKRFTKENTLSPPSRSQIIALHPASVRYPVFGCKGIFILICGTVAPGDKAAFRPSLAGS
jgi:hypothetical protein